MQDAAQVQAQQTQAQRLLEGSVVSSFKYLLVPVPEGASGVGFEVLTLPTAPTSRIGESIEQALLGGDLLTRSWSPQFLKQMLNDVYFKNDVVDVSTRRIWNDMASFYNFQRVVSAEAFLATVTRGVSDKFFGFAAGKEGASYLGLKYGENPGMVNISEVVLLIKADVADAAKRAQATGSGGASGAGGASAAGGASSGTGSSSGAGSSTSGAGTGSAVGAGGSTGGTGGALPTTAKRQFSGLVTLDLTNGSQPIRQVLDEVLANLAGKIAGSRSAIGSMARRGESR